ncbi:MAG: hypothetical protein R3C26_26205 [Calditrichia bacterium]
MGVELDEDKVAKYAEAFKKGGIIITIRIGLVRGWTMTIPGFNYAQVGKHQFKDKG